MTLHFAHIFLTELRTFIIWKASCLALSIDNTSLAQVVRRELHDHAVSRKDSDVMLPYPPRDVTERLMTIRQLHPEH